MLLVGQPRAKIFWYFYLAKARKKRGGREVVVRKLLAVLCWSGYDRLQEHFSFVKVRHGVQC